MTSIFTEREQKLLVAACQSFEGKPKLDMDKFSTLSGLTKGSAKNAWAALRKKIYTDDDGTTPAVPTNTPATKSGKKRPQAVVLPSGDVDDEDGEDSPSKKAKVTKAGKGKAKAKSGKSVKVESELEDEDAWVSLGVKKEVEGEEDGEEEV